MLRLRNATLEDIPTLLYWDQQAHVRDAGILDWPWHEELSVKAVWREQLIATIDHRPIGFVQIMDPSLDPEQYWGTQDCSLRAVDIWIGDKKNLGLGFGTQIMQLALARCFTDSSVTSVIIDPLRSNTAAHRFYESLGFEFLEYRTFDNDECSIFKLSRERWQLRR